MTSSCLPDTLRDGAQLDELLSEPSEGAIAAMRRLEGDLMILGVGGKMGPSLARMARRASEAADVPRRILGVSRFSSGDLEAQLPGQGESKHGGAILLSEERSHQPPRHSERPIHGGREGSHRRARSRSPGL